MAANTLVQTRVDQDVKDRASAVLEAMGLSVSDAVRILLTRTANEGAVPFDLRKSDEAAHDAWFRLRVLEALEGIESGENRLFDEAEWERISHAKRAALKRRIPTPE